MGRPVITNIRPPDGPVWDLNDLEHDEFFALSGTSDFDALIARLHLNGTGQTAEGLGEYDYAFFGTNGSDIITGVTGDEGGNAGVIASGNGSDSVTGGDDNDVIFAGNGKDTVRGGEGEDVLYGENGKDVLCGNEGNDTASGGNGKDVLHGGDGDDRLRGGNGDDALTGGEGADLLAGCRGNDEFRWKQAADFGDTLLDFKAGSDTLVFNVGDMPIEISVGNDDEVVDNFVTGDDAAINVADTEVAIKTDAAVATDDIDDAIDGYASITTGALFAFLDETEGHAVLYYDEDPSTVGGAELVAEFTNITTLDQMAEFTASDFMFV